MAKLSAGAGAPASRGDPVLRRNGQNKCFLQFNGEASPGHRLVHAGGVS